MKTLNDLTAPATVTRPLLEKDVQRQCVDWARARGYWARKFSSQSQRSVPDYLFAKEDLGLYKVHFATEFKRPGQTATPAQQDEIEAMELAGWVVFVCDNFEQFKRRVLEIESAATV